MLNNWDWLEEAPGPAGPLAGPQRHDLESSFQISTRGYHTKMAIYSGFSH